MVEHDCVMKTDVKEMAEGIKAITIDVALMKSDITDLKSATVIMSGCVRTLTESSLVSAQNNITKEKFYASTTEIQNREDISNKTLALHTTYFRIMWVLFGLAWALLFFILDHLWVK